jgi:hypothetical protein
MSSVLSVSLARCGGVLTVWQRLREVLLLRKSMRAHKVLGKLTGSKAESCAVILF